MSERPRREGRGKFVPSRKPRHTERWDGQRQAAHSDSRRSSSTSNLLPPGRAETGGNSPGSTSSAAPHDEGGSIAGPRIHPEAAHMLVGETRFSSTASFLSEAQRSDAATVGSGSALEENDIESVHSPDDEIIHGSRAGPALRGGSGDEASFLRGDLEGQKEPFHAVGSHETRSQAFGGIRGVHNGYKKKDSLISDKQHLVNQKQSVAVNAAVGSEPLKIASAQSQAGEDADEVTSLGVEAHSIGETSLHSLDGLVDTTEAVSLSAAKASSEASYADVINPLYHPEVQGGGRRSPGGTIYKGRGKRRYQGRHMHLPLRRFHEGTSTHFMGSVAFASSLSSDEQGRTIPGYDHRVSERLYRGSDRQERRERSRSRSRSPTQAQLEEDDDKKLPAKSR